MAPPSQQTRRRATAPVIRDAARTPEDHVPYAPDCAKTPSPDALTVLVGLLRDALLLAERATASPAAIDTTMRLGAGHPPGPSN